MFAARNVTFVFNASFVVLFAFFRAFVTFVRLAFVQAIVTEAFVAV
jgi:hypothetical protein